MYHALFGQFPVDTDNGQVGCDADKEMNQEKLDAKVGFAKLDIRIRQQWHEEERLNYIAFTVAAVHTCMHDDDDGLRLDFSVCDSQCQ